MNNQQEIKFKSKKTPLVVGIIMLIIIAPVFLFAFYSLFSPEYATDEKIAFIAAFIFIGFIPGFFAVMSIISYFTNGKRIREGLAKYGEDKLIANIRNNTVSEFKEPLSGHKIYFTDKFVIDPGETIIDYNEISLMYKHVQRSKYGSSSYISFELLDGSSWLLCKNINDEMITNYMQLCFQHNQKIMFGYTKENLAKHKDRVKQYKDGNIIIPKITL